VKRWAISVVFGSFLLGLAVFLTAQGLDMADKWASVLALFVALTTLAMTIPGVLRKHTPPERDQDHNPPRVVVRGPVKHQINGNGNTINIKNNSRNLSFFSRAGSRRRSS